MVEVFSEVKAVLSSNVVAAISGCVEETLRKYVHMASVMKVMLDNDVQYSLSGTLESIVAAQSALQNLLSTLGSKDSITENACNEKENNAVIENENCAVLQVNQCLPAAGTVSSENDRTEVESHDDFPQKIKSSFKKLRFFLRERSRSKTRTNPRLVRHYRSLMKNVPFSSNAVDRDESDILSKDLEQMKLSTENSSDADSRLTEDLPKVGKKSNAKDTSPVSSYKYLCSICSFKTQRSSHFEKHLAIHDKVSTLFKCNHCSFTSVRLSHLRRHEMTHSATVHACGECSYQTDEVKFLLRHIRLKHRSAHTEKFSRVLNCPDCPYHTTKQHYFERHRRMHCSKERRFLHQCEQCCYKTHRKEHYVRHVNNVHNNKRPYLCHLCGKAFKRGDALQQHHQTHAETKVAMGTNYKCDICEKRFRSQSYLWEHQAVHSEARLFLCEICGASFKTRSVQRKHVATIHRNPRAYSCSSCMKRFNTLYALKRHQKVHSEKPLALKETESEIVVERDGIAENASLPIAHPVPVVLEQPNVEPLNPELNHTTVAAFDIPTASQETLTVDVTTALPVHEVIGPASDIIQQIAPAFFQPSENATALLYLTNGLVQF